MRENSVRRIHLRKSVLFVCVASVAGVLAGWTAAAQQKPDPRQQKTLRVNYPMANKKQPAGEVNPATQQIDFYIRSPQQNPKNKPNREVFMHFFGMEVTWK